ncbi:uncharacterized protein LOC110711119 [Chenopodium quinoa]|uniref:uncharacterized protein LOC110711119 n=1 Tax=Chenopodium quinoa TaxID=63459 RepID=UPI000B776836|nr:uncharacterized protein LOC110711119 [Chenopodium quinoa]
MEKSASKRVHGEVVVPAEKARILGVVARKILTMIRNLCPKTDKTRGISLIECDGMDATTTDCHGVLFMRDRVGSKYVSMASKLYTSKWAKQYKGKSKRIMIDVTFSERVIADEETPEVAATKHGGILKGLSCKNITVVSVVFVNWCWIWNVMVSYKELMSTDAVICSCLEKEHWWCAAFYMKENKIYIINFVYSGGTTEHSAILLKLVTLIRK